MSAEVGTARGVTFILPGQLRDLNGGRSRISLDGPCSTAWEAFAALRAEHPAIYERIFTERREVRPHVNVFVDGADIRWSAGLETPVGEGSELVILPAVSGG